MTNTQASNALLLELSQDEPQLKAIENSLIEGADINYQSEEDGYTALMLAVDRDDEALVNYLLLHGANPLLQNHHNEKASEIALNQSPIYQRLKNHELLYATAIQDLPAVEAALASGADVNYQGKDGYTALIIASEQSCLELVELLLRHGADITLERDDGGDALILATDSLIFRTLEYGRPFTAEQKQSLLEPDDEEEEEERREKGRLKAIADRKGQPFTLEQLKMYPLDKGKFRPSPTQAQLDELEKYFKHPLPEILKEIFIKYNGCRPSLDYYGDEETNTMHYFYFLNESRNEIANIWRAIDSCSDYLKSDTLPFAEDDYGGVFFLKWVNKEAQVWLFQYGDQPFSDDDNEEEDESKMPYAFSFLKHSLNEFLEGLYAVEE